MLIISLNFQGNILKRATRIPKNEFARGLSVSFHKIHQSKINLVSQTF
jgi:hypothetical protein